MASLSQISDDVIREIGTYLLPERSTLCALALTHRNLRNVTRELPFRKIEAWVQGSDEIGMERFDQLIWTLERQPDLGTHARYLRLKWPCDTRWHDPDRDAANERANRLLSLTPNIRSLDIQNYSRKCSPFAPPLHLLLNLSLLKEITMADSRSTVHEITQLMQVPNLQKLEVEFMEIHMTPKAQSTTDSETQTLASQLTQLRLAQESHLNPSAFYFLLSVASNIKSLSTNLPVLQSREVSTRRRQRREERMLEKLSPAGVLTCLQPARETLVELNLFDAGVRWPDHDGSRLDLSGFACMKKISLCAVCIFVPDGAWDGRKGLGEL